MTLRNPGQQVASPFGAPFFYLSKYRSAKRTHILLRVFDYSQLVLLVIRQLLNLLMTLGEEAYYIRDCKLKF